MGVGGHGGGEGVEGGLGATRELGVGLGLCSWGNELSEGLGQYFGEDDARGRRCHKNYIRNKMKTLKFIAKKETNVKKYRNKTGDQTS